MNKWVIIMGKNNVWWHTLWSLKYFLKDIPAIPICLNKLKTLLGEPPDKSIPKLSRRLPAGIFEPGTFGWLHHTFSLLLQLLFPQTVLTSTKVPTCLVSTSGLSDLQDGQMLNSSCNSWERKQCTSVLFGCLDLFCSIYYGGKERELVIFFIK